MTSSSTDVSVSHPEGGDESTAVEEPLRIDSAIRAVSRYGMLVGLAVMIVLARVLYDGFFERQNIENILTQSAPVGIVAVGMTYVMIGGGFDLSVGSTFALGAVLFADLSLQMDPASAAAISVAVGAIAGLSNGVLVTRFGINRSLRHLGPHPSSVELRYYTPTQHQSSSSVARDSIFLGRNEIAGTPVSIWLLIAVFTVGNITLARTVYGRSLYAVGGNFEAARLAGLQAARLRASTYVLSGVAAALGGMLLASRIGVGQADVGGNIALDSIAVTVIGGTSLFGGEGAVWRTAVGLMILATMTNIFDSLALPYPGQLVVKGLIIIFAVGMDAFARSRR